MPTKRRKPADVESLLGEARTAVRGFHVGLAKGLTDRRLADLAAVERDLRDAVASVATEDERQALTHFAHALADLTANMRNLAQQVKIAATNN